MAYKYTDVATIEEMLVFFGGRKVAYPGSREHFLEIVYLKQANAESTFTLL